MGRKTKQNDITTDKLHLVNEENIRLLNDFLLYLKSVRRSEKTIKGYKNDIEIFFCYLLEFSKNKFYCDVTKRDLVAYQGWLLDTNKNSPARVRRLKASLSSLSNYIINILDEEYPNYKAIIRRVENPGNAPVREKTVLSEEQLDYLLNELVEKKKYQQACMTALVAFCGCRKAEAVRFKTDYFKDENIIYGSLYKTPEKILCKGQNGGEWLHKFIIVNKFKPFLEKWLQQRKELGIDSEWLFMTKNKGVWEPAKADLLNSWALTNSEILGLDFYWHCLRHMFVSYLLKEGLPDSVVVDLVGWKTPGMIKIYDDNPIEDKFEKYFDVDGIKQVKQSGLDDL